MTDPVDRPFEGLTEDALAEGIARFSTLRDALLEDPPPSLGDTAEEALSHLRALTEKNYQSLLAEVTRREAARSSGVPNE